MKPLTKQERHYLRAIARVSLARVASYAAIVSDTAQLAFAAQVARRFPK